MEMEKKEYTLNVPFERKSIIEGKDETGEFAYFEGYASTFGNIDRVDDIIHERAFDRCLSKGCKVKMLWQHGFKDVIGSYPDLKTDSNGLFVKGRINLGTEKGREAYALLKADDLDSMSIGFFIPKGGSEYNKDGIRILKEIDLFEISIVTMPANPLAIVSSVKSVTSFKDFPLAERDVEWDNSKAIERIKEFTGSTESLSDTYKNAFLWCDSEKADFKLPYVDVIDGELKAVPRAIFAAAAALRGAKGGVELPDNDEDKVVNHIIKYYNKMELDNPFEKSIKDVESMKDINCYLKINGLSKTDRNTLISKIKSISASDEKRQQEAEKVEKEKQAEVEKKEKEKQDLDEVLKNLNKCINKK